MNEQLKQMRTWLEEAKRLATIRMRAAPTNLIASEEAGMVRAYQHSIVHLLHLAASEQQGGGAGDGVHAE